MIGTSSSSTVVVERHIHIDQKLCVHLEVWQRLVFPRQHCGVDVQCVHELHVSPETSTASSKTSDGSHGRSHDAPKVHPNQLHNAC